MQFWIIQGLNSLSLGGLLFLLSSGFSLIFGLMRLANLTHGAFFMLGTYFAAIAMRSYDGLNIWGNGARCRHRRRRDRRPVRAAGSGAAQNQPAWAGPRDARHVLHHFRCMPDAMGWRFHSGPNAAKPAGSDAAVRVCVSDLPPGAGRMRHHGGHRAVFSPGANAARSDDPRRCRRRADGSRGRHPRLEAIHHGFLSGRRNCRCRRRAGAAPSFQPIRDWTPTCFR